MMRRGGTLCGRGLCWMLRWSRFSLLEREGEYGDWQCMAVKLRKGCQYQQIGREVRHANLIFQIQLMSQEAYFEQYVDILGDGIKKIRKIGFKKLNLINDLLNTLTTYLSKEVYGRIEPANYLLLFLMALGGRNHKLYAPIIQTIQRIISNNYINPSDDLSGCLRLVKDDHKELLLLPFEDYSRKTFQQIYIETLIALPDRSQQINLLASKNMSLIFRLSQNYIPVPVVTSICDFMVDSILTNKSIEYDPILKSSFLEIVRHAVESYRQTSDHKSIVEDEQVSVKNFCARYGASLADQVAIQLEVQSKYEVHNYQPIPQDINNFKLLKVEIQNEKGQVSGKFGWCVVCRKTANYYCRAERVAVCSYNCKQINLYQNQQLDKFLLEQSKSMTIFSSHIDAFCKIFHFYLSHQDIRKREVFAGIFLHLSSELRKIPVSSMTPTMKNDIQMIFRQCCVNIVLETEAFIDCLKSIKKLMPLKISNPETAILLHQLAQKLTHFITPAPVKMEILKFCGDLIRSDLLFECFMELDCNIRRKDAVKELISAITQLYIGVKPPAGLTVYPPEQPQTRALALQTLNLLVNAVKANNKPLSQSIIDRITKAKNEKNALKSAIQRFNESEKPGKVIKKLISQKFLVEDPASIASFLHKNLKRLSFVNVGVLIGGYDPFEIAIRDEFIGQMDFRGFLVDEGLRILLRHFTIPGESQVVERIIECFSNLYYQQNKQLDKQNVFHHSDSVYSFSYLLMMLQTNLHNPQVIEKMTFAQFSNLSKNMNSKGSEFPQKFLETIYKSIEEKQLGFHSKHKQIQIIKAYQQGQIKRAQQIHTKELDWYIHHEFEHLREWDPHQELTFNKFCTKLLVSELFESIIEAYSIEIRDSEDKDDILKAVDKIEGMVKFSLSLDIEDLVAHSCKCLWEEITKCTVNTIKKYMLYEKYLNWIREFAPYIYGHWTTVIGVLSSFHRSKAIKKDTSGKNNIIMIANDRCFLYDSYINNLMAKSAKFNNKNLYKMGEALIQTSKQEIAENYTPFCLEKIGEILQHNNSRLAEILPLVWPKLRDHYVELGCHKSEKLALFGTDFLKQLVTKFIKKKDLLFYQKEYLRPFQDIFNTNGALGVKQYVVGGLSYFVNNYFQNIKEGWKIILSILCDSFDEDEDPIVKEKSHGIVRKIYESNFLILDIDENYVDFVQILGRMAREKDEVYPKSCIDAIQTITSFYHKKLGINLDNPSAPENEKLDINFWQTMWLPLLSILYGICGDFRADVQSEAIECLFDILMRYGKLFKYEFWKMIMQGILRPTFEEITYTSQLKSLPKASLNDWLRTSFSLLFVSINKLVCLYFADFKLFLPDILKIYQSCILSNSNRILTQLASEALTDLLCNVGDFFEPLNWSEYIDFVDAISRKGFPYELTSLESWKKSQNDSLQNSYQGKCLTMSLLLLNCQTVLQKFNKQLQEKDIEEIEEIIVKAYEFCKTLNRNIELRQALWKNGFFTEMKSLPGLIKHEHEALKAITACKFRLSQKSQTRIDEYAQHFLKLLGEYRKCLITEPPKNPSLQLEQEERQCTMLHTILTDSALKHIQTIGLPKLVELGYQQFLLDGFLGCMAQKTYCSKCQFCSTCEASGDRERKFTEQMQSLIKELFVIRQ